MVGTVMAVNISREKGTQKENIGAGTFVEDWGLEGDAHAGKWHRQVSLLSYETFEAFRDKQADILQAAEKKRKQEEEFSSESDAGRTDGTGVTEIQKDTHIDIRQLVRAGSFGENLLVSGIDFKNLPVGTRLQCGDVVLEITQIGKKCHSGCEIYKLMGDCIMPREGVFAKVLHGGVISTGDEMRLC